MAQLQFPTVYNARNHTDYIERNLPFVDLHSGTDTPWWTLPLWGNYSFGYDTGVKMARRLLAFYGSGQVEADNNYLAHIAGSFIKRQQMIDVAGKDSESHCLRGQYSGFFGTLSKFLAPAAFMNGCGMTERNDFEPVRLPCPLVPAAPDETVQQTEPAAPDELPLPTTPASSTNTLTMSSREIAELVNSRHDDVKRSIERLAERGVIVHPPLADGQLTDKIGRPRTEKVYKIGKRDSYVIVAQLCPEFTARLVDRWQELEQATAGGTLHPAPTAGDLAELRESVRRLEYALKGISAPAARRRAARTCRRPEYRISSPAPEGSLSVQEFAARLRMGKNQLYAFLKSQGLLLQSNIAVADFVTQGILAYEQRSSIDRHGGRQQWNIVCITREGQEFVRSLISRS